MKLLKVILSATFALAGSSAFAEELLRFAAWGPPGAPINAAYAEWAEHVNEVAREEGVDLRIDVIWNSLGAGRQALASLERGVADMAWILPTMHPGRFTFLEEFEGFGASGDSEAVSASAWSEYLELGSDAVEGVVPLAFVAIGPTHLHVNAETQPDLSGAQIRVAGPSNAIAVRDLGAHPVQLEWTGITSALRSGQLNGTISPWNGFFSISLQDATNYHSNENFGFIMGMVAISERSYRRLSQPARQILIQNTGLELSIEIGTVARNEAEMIRDDVLSRPEHSSFSLVD